jgi:hypothetical protein
VLSARVRPAAPRRDEGEDGLSGGLLLAELAGERQPLVAGHLGVGELTGHRERERQPVQRGGQQPDGTGAPGDPHRAQVEPVRRGLVAEQQRRLAGPQQGEGLFAAARAPHDPVQPGRAVLPVVDGDRGHPGQHVDNGPVLGVRVGRHRRDQLAQLGDPVAVARERGRLTGQRQPGEGGARFGRGRHQQRVRGVG